MAFGKKKEKKPTYYRLDEILKYKAIYRMIIGERSNGKSFAVLEYAIRKYWEDGGQLAVIRRWQDDFRGKRGEVMFDGLAAAGKISEITDGAWETVYYWSGRWYLAKYKDVEGKDGETERKLVKAEKPFAYAFALSAQEHDKSTSYPMIKRVFFDEFLTRGQYLADEFVLFMNVLSTIIRDRDDVEIFMAANTVSQYAPYFDEMGLKNIKEMKPGSIELYEYGDSGLSVAVEFSDTSHDRKKPSDKYFAFDNPRLSMITGKNGIWEIALYPHAPCKWRNKDVVFSYFIDFDHELLQGDVISVDGRVFTFIHRKTTPIQKPDADLIYSQQYDPRPNWHRNLRRGKQPVDIKIGRFFSDEKVYYQDNGVGETIRAYLDWCNT